MKISNVSKVNAVLTQKGTEEKKVELDMLESGEIVLMDLSPDETLELFVMYEGPYTEFDYRVSKDNITSH